MVLGSEGYRFYFIFCHNFLCPTAVNLNPIDCNSVLKERINSKINPGNPAFACTSTGTFLLRYFTRLMTHGVTWAPLPRTFLPGTRTYLFKKRKNTQAQVLGFTSTSVLFLQNFHIFLIKIFVLLCEVDLCECLIFLLDTTHYRFVHVELGYDLLLCWQVVKNYFCGRSNKMWKSGKFFLGYAAVRSHMSEREDRVICNRSVA